MARKTAKTSGQLPRKQMPVRQMKKNNRDDEVENEIAFKRQDEIKKAIEEVSKTTMEVLNQGKTVTNPELTAFHLAEDKIQRNDEEMEVSDDDSDIEMSLDNCMENPRFKSTPGEASISNALPTDDSENPPLNFFFPIVSNVDGLIEPQLSNFPDTNQDVKFVRTKILEAYENGVHGYELDAHEHSEQLLFEVMKRLLPTTNNADLLYLALHSVFPNIGTHLEISKMFPKLCQKYASEDESLVGLEEWKAPEEQVEDVPVLRRLAEPEVLQHFIVKQMNLKVEKRDVRCSKACFRNLRPAYFEEMLEKLDSRGNPSEVKLYVARRVTNAKIAAFLNDLLFRSEASITQFCEHAKPHARTHPKYNTCAKWFKVLMDNSTIPGSSSFATTMEQYKEDQADYKNRIYRFRVAVNNKSPTVHPLTPCNHVGSCGPKRLHCSCKKYCTAACQCRYDCSMKFPGCNCEEVDGQSCGTSTCPCVFLQLECNPLTCNTCLKKDNDTSEHPPCANETLGRGAMVVIDVKKSGVPQIEGNGAFLGEAVRKHQCLGEYVGEVIPDEEVERRGQVDHFSCSYIFGLGEDFEAAVDARRTGNNLRFVNHSKKPNCAVRRMVVHGKVLIGFYALEDLKEGTELFFDYGYSKSDQKHFFGSASSSKKK
ncbi:unnamed protein product [Caenorhabditis nigoni]